MTLNRCSFEAELVKLSPALNRFAMHLHRNRSDAHDLVQDTLCRSLESWASYNPTYSLKPWLFTIMRNLFVDDYRKRRNLPNQFEADAVALRAVVIPAQYWTVALREVDSAIAALPSFLSDALIEVAFGSSYEEAACKLNREVNTVKTHVRRARKRLADQDFTMQSIDVNHQSTVASVRHRNVSDN